MADLPYRCEYAETGRSSCKGCRTTIAEGEIRFAAMMHSPMFDNKQPHWYHVSCFFEWQFVESVDDIYNFESLRLEDQEKIRPKVGGTNRKNHSAKKRSTSATNGIWDFCVQYAKSNRSWCRGCNKKIEKEDVRISKKDYESKVARRCGSVDRWHHVDCFVQLRSDLQYCESGANLPGIKTLSPEHQAEIKEKLPKIMSNPLHNMEFVILGNISGNRDDLKIAIKKLGGKITGSIHPTITAIISKKETVDKMGKKMELAKSYGIPVVPKSFVESVKDRPTLDNIRSMNLAPWINDVCLERDLLEKKCVQREDLS